MKQNGEHEFMSQMQQALMRPPLHERGAMSMGKLGINVAEQLVMRDGTPVTLRGSEYRRLIALANDPTRVFNRSEFAFYLYGCKRPIAGRAVDLVVHRLRNKLGAGAIMTVRGVGYRMSYFL